MELMSENNSLSFPAHKEIVRAQIERFHVYYIDYFKREETLRMVEYFFEKVYNVEGKQDWVKIAIEGFDKVKSMIKESTRDSMEELLELNYLTDRLDTMMAELLLKKGWKGEQISREFYDSLFSELGHEEDRKKQLFHVLKNMRQFYSLAHRPINSIILKPAKFMSKILGIYPLFATVEEGYHACLPVKTEIFESFYADVEKKEWNYLKERFPNISR